MTDAEKWFRVETEERYMMTGFDEHEIDHREMAVCRTCLTRMLREDAGAYCTHCSNIAGTAMEHGRTVLLRDALRKAIAGLDECMDRNDWRQVFIVRNELIAAYDADIETGNKLAAGPPWIPPTPE